MKKSLGIYIHVPFCKSKCIYCDFYSLSGEEKRIPAYFDALKLQITETGSVSQNCVVDTIYFGGGTPSYIDEKYLLDTLAAIKKHFKVNRNCEITLEANPESCTEQKLKKLYKGGFNRISVGLQSTNDAQLVTCGRIHTFDEGKQAVKNALKAGFRNVSVDLIYGLPDQTLDDWRSTLETIASFPIQHISCYGLKVEEGTPLFDMADDMNLPDDDLQADMYLCAVDYLEQQGFRQYEISNFAKTIYQSKHNLKYWNMEDYLGFGPGAHSDFGNVRYSYIRDLKQYISAVIAGDTIIDEYQEIKPHERAYEYLMLKLRTTEGINESDYSGKYRMEFAPIEELLKGYKRHGLAENAGSSWRLTAKGFLVSNPIIMALTEAQQPKKWKPLV